jgi:hypothetical protein
MAGGVLQIEDVGPADSARILDFINGADNASMLAATVGFSEGPTVGLQVAEAIVRAGTVAPFRTLEELLAVTGVNLARFTEIAVALSGARPPAGGLTMRLTPTSTRPWLGQRVAITGQLLDAQRVGVPGVEISCVASSGILSAPNSRGEIQRGGAVRLMTEPGGIVRLEFHPQLAPPLDADARTALESELGGLGPENATPASVAPALAAFAERYRAEASTALREAVDRLFEAYPVTAAGVGSTWPVETVTILAFADGPAGEPMLAGATTLFVRNWLGAWLSALGEAIHSDKRLDNAIAEFEFTDADAAFTLVAATQAFAGLELGVVGGRERDKFSAHLTDRFLQRLGDNVDPLVLENVVRAAGASNAATAAGGFLMFEAIQTVQNVSDTIGPQRGIDAGKLGAFDGRLGQLEATTVDKATLDKFGRDMLTQTEGKLTEVGGKIASLETDRVTRTQLAALAAQISAKADVTALNGLDQSFKAQIDGRLNSLRTELNTATDTKVAVVAGKVASLETDRVTRTQLAGVAALIGAKADQTALAGLDQSLNVRLNSLRTELNTATETKVAVVAGKVAALESDRVTKADLTSMESRLQRFASDLGNTRAELLLQINAKADQAAVVGLNQSVTKLQTENQRLATQVQGVDFDVLRNTRTQPRGPGR